MPERVSPGSFREQNISSFQTPVPVKTSQDFESILSKKTSAPSVEDLTLTDTFSAKMMIEDAINCGQLSIGQVTKLLMNEMIPERRTVNMLKLMPQDIGAKIFAQIGTQDPSRATRMINLLKHDLLPANITDANSFVMACDPNTQASIKDKLDTIDPAWAQAIWEFSSVSFDKRTEAMRQRMAADRA